MKKQCISIAAAIAFAFAAGALLADNGLEAGPESLGKINSTDGIILAKHYGSKAPGSYKMPRRPLRLLSSHLSRTSSVRATRRRDQRVKPGERVYFYYKVGPVRLRRRSAPIKTRLVVRKAGRTIYNGSWRRREAVRSGTYQTGKYLNYYHSSQWSYRVPTYKAGGRYTATIYFRDVNHGQTLSINYSFTVKKSSRFNDRNRGRYDRGRDNRYGRTRQYRTKPRRATRYYNRSRYGKTRYQRSGTKYYR